MNNSQAIVDTIAAFVQAYKSATAGGAKLGWTSLFSLGPALMTLPTAVNGAGAALKEWETATDADRATLEAYIGQKFPNADAAVAAKVGAGVEVAVKLGGLYSDVMILIGKGPVAAPAPALASTDSVSAQAKPAAKKAGSEASKA